MQQDLEVRNAATHNGPPHYDDLIGGGIVKLAFPEAEIHRVRQDGPELMYMDLLFDIGGKYDPEKLIFDHRVWEDGAGVRENGVAYSSAGLLWNFPKISERIIPAIVMDCIGLAKRHLVNLPEVFDEATIFEHVHSAIDSSIMLAVDANDNGQLVNKGYFKNDESIAIHVPTLRDYIEVNRPSFWDRSSEAYDEFFTSTVDNVIEPFLRNRIAKLVDRLILSESISHCIATSNESILIVDIGSPVERGECWDSISRYDLPAKFVVFHHAQGHWVVSTVNDYEDGGSVRRAEFPSEWKGLHYSRGGDKELQKLSGVDDAMYCDHRGLTAGAHSKAGAVELAKKSLANL